MIPTTENIQRSAWAKRPLQVKQATLHFYVHFHMLDVFDVILITVSYYDTCCTFIKMYTPVTPKSILQSYRKLFDRDSALRKLQLQGICRRSNR